MRSFNSFEKSIIDSLCRQDKKSRKSETAVSRSLIYLMEKSCGVTKIRWNKSKTKLEVYGLSEKNRQASKWKLLDFVNLIKWLETNGYVYLFENTEAIKIDEKQGKVISTKSSAKCFFVFSVRLDFQIEVNEPTNTDEEENVKQIKEEVPEIATQMPTSLLHDLSRIASSYVHVTQNLHDLKKHCYLTLEQVYEFFAIFVAIFVGVFSIVMNLLHNSCSGFYWIKFCS